VLCNSIQSGCPGAGLAITSLITTEPDAIVSAPSLKPGEPPGCTLGRQARFSPSLFGSTVAGSVTVREKPCPSV